MHESGRAGALVFEVAGEADMPALARMRTDVARDLSRQFGHGHWASEVSERAVWRSLRHATVLIARREDEIIATLRLANKKPWAIDRTYFTDVVRPIYLTDMAVAPHAQRAGVGRAMVREAQVRVAAIANASIRLDAYDGLAGAGPFYARCGFREVGHVVYRNVPLVYFEWLPAPWLSSP